MKRILLTAAAILAVPAIALAFVSYTTPAGQTLGGAVLLWLNGSGQAVEASAANPLPTLVSPAATTPVGTPQYGLAVATATSLTVPTGALMAQITVEGEPIRCREDGTAPTATVGTLYQVGTVLKAWGSTMTALQCIQTAASATLDVEYFK